MPYVRAIASADDAPGMHGIGIADHPLFARDVIRYDGEPIAAVAAGTLEQAKAAAAAIILELELEGAARGGNVAWEAKVVGGDTDAAFARPDVEIIDSCFRVGRQNRVPFEPRAVVASFEDGRFHIQTSTQVPWTVRHATAKVLGVPDSQVRVTVPPVGGAFGLKFDCSLEPFAAILARATGHRVALVNSRREEMLTCLCRENAKIRIRSAATKAGEIVGREATVLMDCGAYGGQQVS